MDDGRGLKGWGKSAMLRSGSGSGSMEHISYPDPAK